MGGLTEGTSVTDGVQHCSCINPRDALGALVIATGKLLPSGSWLDGHTFDFGGSEAIAVIRHDGSRHAVRFRADSRPDALWVADALA